jgi:hypothetical protein
MRLIDADTLLENYNLKNMHKYNADGSLNREATNTLMLYEVADMIKDAPTAYDVDKVRKKLSEAKDIDNLIDCDHAIKIVKQGINNI